MKFNCNYFNCRHNLTLPSIMISCLLVISLNCWCISSLPLNDPGQSLIGDYTFTGLTDDSQPDPSSSSPLSGSSGPSAVGLIPMVNGINNPTLDSAKQWIQLKNLLTDLERQKTSPSNHRFHEMLNKDDHSNQKIMIERLGGHQMGKFLFTGKRNVGQICLPGTGCEYLDMGREAEAKEFLNPSSSTNPGKRRRRRTLITSSI